MTNLQRKDRMKMVIAMEYIARCVNNEDIFDAWLLSGVADGDLPANEILISCRENPELDYYIQDKNFSELMQVFLRLMSAARKDGGLYSGGIVS